MSVKLRHVGIVTSDIEKSLDYYKTVYNAKVLDDQIEKVRIIKLDNGVELIQYESQSENNLRKVGISHIAFTIDPDGNPQEGVWLSGQVGK